MRRHPRCLLLLTAFLALPAAPLAQAQMPPTERELRIYAGLHDAAAYAVVMAYRIRFYMDMNAREAMHLIELRTAPQGHPSYRRIAQLMHRAIAEVAGHRAVAAAMEFADHSAVELERLHAERAMERKRQSFAQ